ncbi:ABZJ_00895 family protein [Mesorhizobium sp. M0074]|uniref:ABZJ_00895 family protein n=1 Tax=unclassified Mesorhizobium TaxID=325217 RepID=UPI00333A5A17
MPHSQNDRFRIALYVSLYTGIYVITFSVVALISTIVLAIDPYMLAKIGRFIQFAIQLVAAFMTYFVFIKRHAQLFTRTEFWKMVGFSTLIEMILGMAVLLPSGLLRAIPPQTSVLAVMIGGIVAFLATSLGYSNRFGNTILKAELVRRAKMDSETFR